MADKDMSQKAPEGMPEDFLALLEEAKASKENAKEKARDSRNPVVLKRKFGSRNKLFPFGEKPLEGYRLPDSDEEDITIVCGNARRSDKDILMVSSKDKEIPLKLSKADISKLEYLKEGTRVTAAVKDGKCLALKLGPFFGDSFWKLFYKNNTKSVTEFVVR